VKLVPFPAALVRVPGKLTVSLDEIATLPPEMEPPLLRSSILRISVAGCQLPSSSRRRRAYVSVSTTVRVRCAIPARSRRSGASGARPVRSSVGGRTVHAALPWTGTTARGDACATPSAAAAHRHGGEDEHQRRAELRHARQLVGTVLSVSTMTL
jgi:hypothetical protein